MSVMDGNVKISTKTIKKNTADNYYARHSWWLRHRGLVFDPPQQQNVQNDNSQQGKRSKCHVKYINFIEDKRKEQNMGCIT